MARRPFIAGNWKMNTTRQEAVQLARSVADGFQAADRVDVAVCPPSLYLEAVGKAIEGTPVELGAQNMYHESFGAYTGEISGPMLIDLGCRYVILGHSERRQYFQETDGAVNRKIRAALEIGLVPILCLGETLDQRQAGQTQEVVRSQFDGSTADLLAEQMESVVIAYEPVWAIGTGVTATKEQAEEVHADLRKMIEARYNSQIAESVRILYGGSVKPANAAELLGQPNIDGALVGGASLKASDFLAIVSAAES